MTPYRYVKQRTDPQVSRLLAEELVVLLDAKMDSDYSAARVTSESETWSAGHPYEAGRDRALSAPVTTPPLSRGRVAPCPVRPELSLRAEPTSTRRRQAMASPRATRGSDVHDLLQADYDEGAERPRRPIIVRDLKGCPHQTKRPGRQD